MQTENLEKDTYSLRKEIRFGVIMIAINMIIFLLLSHPFGGQPSVYTRIIRFFIGC